MNNRFAWVLFLLAAIACAVATTSWYQSREQGRDLRHSLLTPMAALSKEDQGILLALRADSSEAGILGSYLAKIRADGVAKHADMKQRLDRLAENNAALLALIDVYKPLATSAAFNAEAGKFQRYAIAWRDRWNSVMELFMAGGNYPVAEVPFPTEFLPLIEAELAAVK